MWWAFRAAVEEEWVEEGSAAVAAALDKAPHSGSGAVTVPAPAAGRRDTCKALWDHGGLPSRPHLTEAWSWTGSKRNGHSNWWWMDEQNKKEQMMEQNRQQNKWNDMIQNEMKRGLNEYITV